MKDYLAPEVTYLGDLAELTGITGDPVEQDTYVDAEGNLGHSSGPVSEIFCETNQNLEICTD